MRILAALAFACLVLASPAGYAYQSGYPAKPLAGSVVKVVLKTGHGSATHIGDGYFVTAAHVVSDQKDIRIKADDSTIHTDVEVLWANTTYDIALIRVKNFDGQIKATNLSCRDPVVGETVSMSGSPMILEFVTSWGRIGSRVSSIGPWPVAYELDGTLGPGMSGGGVFDAAGNLIGVNVGVLLIYGAPSGFSVIVPTSAFCALSARGV
jgi:serine protease Do